MKRLSGAGLLREENGRWRRVIIEKPFGHDLASARELNTQLTSVLWVAPPILSNCFLNLF
jgi:glucose-6-phosphate 1-dehydrogenase